MTKILELAAHVARRSGRPTQRRNYTRELKEQAAKGWIVVASCPPADGEPVAYAPRSASDPQPWTYTDLHGCEWRFNGRECHTVERCPREFLRGTCALPQDHDKACKPRT